MIERPNNQRNLEGEQDSHDEGTETERETEGRFEDIISESAPTPGNWEDY